jgi:hypothetical protein
MARVGRDRPCLVCGKADWCLRAGDDSAAICARIAEGAVRQVGGAGWLHRFGPADPWRRPRQITLSVPQARLREDLEALVAKFQGAVDPGQLERLAANLGLTVPSLRRLGVGWCEGSRAWSFPMVDSAGRVRGIRLRASSGRKFAVKGGHDGLFIPDGLDASGLLLVAEGPTDTAALLDLGFEAIGRPSCRGGVDLLVSIVRARRPDDLAIISDGDVPGRAGADELAATLVAYALRVRVVAPPEGIKDARAWKRSGARREDVLRTIEAAPERRLKIRARLVRSSQLRGRAGHVR